MAEAASTRLASRGFLGGLTYFLVRDVLFFLQGVLAGTAVFRAEGAALHVDANAVAAHRAAGTTILGAC